MFARLIFCALVAALSCACAPLTAEHPLFAVSDQIGPAPLTEGVWIMLNDKCPPSRARRRHLPDDCSPVRISRLPDDAWQMAPLNPRRDPEHAKEDAPYRFVIAPAIEHPSADAYAPIYIAEGFQTGTEDQQHPQYAVIAPIDSLPAVNLYFMVVECGDILRDGPIRGVRVIYGARDAAHPDESPPIEKCIAADQRAVREAARREIIESLSHLESSHMLFVRR